MLGQNFSIPDQVLRFKLICTQSESNVQFHAVECFFFSLNSAENGPPPSFFTDAIKHFYRVFSVRSSSAPQAMVASVKISSTPYLTFFVAKQFDDIQSPAIRRTFRLAIADVRSLISRSTLKSRPRRSHIDRIAVSTQSIAIETISTSVL